MHVILCTPIPFLISLSFLFGKFVFGQLDLSELVLFLL
jgi:hypothetical protein